jgi:hypothetical protein
MTCRNCSKEVRPLAKNGSDPRGLDMSVIDRRRLFCTMRCAARWAVTKIGNPGA